MGPRRSAPLPNRNWCGVDGAARERALAKPELLIRNANLSPHAFNLVAGHEMPDGGFAARREGVAA